MRGVSLSGSVVLTERSAGAEDSMRLSTTGTVALAGGVPGGGSPAAQTFGWAGATSEGRAEVATPHPEGGGTHHPALAAVAEALGLTPDELRDELLAGHTLAHMASTRGVDAERVTEALAAAEPPPAPPAPTPGVAAPDDLAALVGLPADELHEAEASGRTLAEIAEANGVPRSKLIDALVTRSANHIRSLTD
jgi:hypothetical protein